MGLESGGSLALYFFGSIPPPSYDDTDFVEGLRPVQCGGQTPSSRT